MGISVRPTRPERAVGAAMKQPDRFEQMVKKASRIAFLFDDDVIRLLRRQHARVVRMIILNKQKVDHSMRGAVGYNQACNDLLAALAKMKKGKP